MLFGVSSWAYMGEGCAAEAVVDELLDAGFTALSFSTSPLGRLAPSELAALAGHVCDRGAPVTLHGLASIERAELGRIVEPFLPVLRCVTCDPSWNAHPTGWQYAAGELARAAHRALVLTEGTGVRVGIEDFPINAEAVEHFRADLAPVLGDPRLGILIDIGHMHMRLSGRGYFAGMSVAEHLARVPLEIIEVHVHDNDGRGDQHAPLGSGTVDFAAVAAGLNAAGFAGVATIEIVPAQHGAQTVAARLAMARACLQRWREVWSAVAGG